MYVEWLCNAMYIMGGSYHDGTWRSYSCVGSNEVKIFEGLELHDGETSQHRCGGFERLHSFAEEVTHDCEEQCVSSNLFTHHFLSLHPSLLIGHLKECYT
jgi:hypothetical protein